MEILKLILILLIFSCCTRNNSKYGTEKLDNTESGNEELVVNDSISYSQKYVNIREFFPFPSHYYVCGELVDLGNMIRMEYDKALVAHDTLIIVVKEKSLLSLFDFNEIRKPLTEPQLNVLFKKYKLSRTVKNSEMESNTDGNYEIPYLFYTDERDSVMYEICQQSVIDKKKPYTYEFCEAIIRRNSHNAIGQKVYGALSKLNVDSFIRKYPCYRYIWFILTDCIYEDKEQKHEFSILVKQHDSEIESVLLTIDHDAILKNDNMSLYMSN